MNDSGWRKKVRRVKDYPIEGVVFSDLTPVLADTDSRNEVIEGILKVLYEDDVFFDRILAVDARGFVWGSLLAERLNKPLYLIRKEGKLPGRVVRFESRNEYAIEVLEVQEEVLEDKSPALVVDDVYATGGTLRAILSVLRGAGVEATGVVVLDIGLSSRPSSVRALLTEGKDEG